MKKRLLSVAILVTFLFGTMSFAKEAEPVQDEVTVIDAEEIGIAPMQDFEEEEIQEDVFEEPEEEFEDSEEEWEEDIQEEEAEDVEEDYEEETEEDVSPEPPEGMVEGYEEGVYFEPNTYDCDTCDECYTCPEDSHVYAHCISVDEDNSYILEEWCTICGHGTGKTITGEEFEALGVGLYEEF